MPALAARGIPAAELAGLLDRLAFEAADRDAIVAVATQADAVAHALQRARSGSQIADAARARRRSWSPSRARSGLPSRPSEWLGDLRHVTLEIDGGDLLAAGVPQGPAVGRGLRAALAAKLDARASGREAELAVAIDAALRS